MPEGGTLEPRTLGTRAGPAGLGAPVLDFIVSLSGLIVSLVAGVVWLLARPSAAGPRRWLTTVVVVYGLASTPFVGQLLSRPLVWGFARFDAAQAPPHLGAIVVLGAGTLTIHGRDQKLGVLDLDAASRVLEAARVYQDLGHPAIWVISSGGASPGFDTVPDAISMRDALLTLGIPSQQILLESMSTNTHDEAVRIAPMLRQLDVDRFVLVTSDIHMRRALPTFEKQGLHPVPAIASNLSGRRAPFRLLAPTVQGITFTEEVLHEYFGLASYSVRGWL